MDAAGNLYGTSEAGGTYDSGSVFKLTPGNDSWSYTDLFNFKFRDGVVNLTGYQPLSSVTLDASGNLYGTATLGGLTGIICTAGCGVVWEITP
jgi:uncharacterized repeat protein (TIGR03803 family)